MTDPELLKASLEVSTRWLEGKLSKTEMARLGRACVASLAQEAEHHAIVMSYEAMRICLGLPTKYHAPKEVIRWMETVTNTP